MEPPHIKKLLDEVKWGKVDYGPGGPTPPPPEHADLPYVTHTGILRIGGMALKVAMLSNGERIIEEDSVADLFGLGRN